MNYNTEIILNPTDINIDMVDFSIEVSAGQNVIFVDQVNSDWNSEIGLSKILNKPYIPVKTSDLHNDNEFITIADVPVQVNSDWNSNSGYSQILNKPLIPNISYQSTPPTNPNLNDIWVSSVTLIQYQWIGSWVNFNLQSLSQFFLIDGGGSMSTTTDNIDGGQSNSTITIIINGGNALNN